jgi:hypothetical protein
MLQTTCPNCGATAGPNSKFCSTCGAGLGWGVKIKDIQSQLTQTEANLMAAFGQYSGEMRNSITGIQGDIQNTLSAYSNEMVSNQRTLNETSNNISTLIKEERRLALSKSLNRSGLGLIAIGLGIIASTNFFKDVTLLPVIGLGVIFIGFIISVIANFFS